MPSPDLPISHATHLVPFARFLDAIGSPIERGLEQMHLPASLIDTPDCYVPTQSLFGFVGLMADKEGIDDLGFRVAHETGLGLMGPSMAAQVSRSPTLLHGIRTFCDLVGREASNFWSWYVEGRDEVRFYVHRTFKPGTLGYTQTEWIGVIAMTTLVQLFAGPKWEPSRISLGTGKPVPRIARETLGDTRFLIAQPDVYIAFPRSMLSLRRYEHTGEPRLAVPQTPASSYGDEAAAVDFAGRLRQCLAPHLADGYPHITLASEIAATSVRTLQRRLSDLGLTYSDLVARARFDAAAKLLADSNAPIIEIALATGYSDPSHFARAFRRLAGVTPRQYRKQARPLSAE